MGEPAGIPGRSHNVFLAHSPFQVFMAGHMIGSMAEFRSAHNRLVIDRVWGESETDSAGWDDIVELSPPVGGTVIGAGRRLKAAVSQVVVALQAADPARLFLTNIQWPLNNAVLAAVSAENKRRSVRVCNYPEGIGSLRLVYPTAGQRLRDLMKRVVGVFNGATYRPIKSDLMGLERCDVIYSLLPHLLPVEVRHKAVAIPAFPSPTVTVERDTCIFLGQNDRLLATALRRSVASSAANYCLTLPYKRFRYKPHHYGQSDVQRQTFLERGFEEIADSRPVEQMLMSQPVACVASFNSSALVHLKMMYGERVRCIACFPNLFGRLARSREDRSEAVRSLFERSGVEIMDDTTISPGEQLVS